MLPRTTSRAPLQG